MLFGIEANQNPLITDVV